MKKTLALTICMLVFFGMAVAVMSGKVSESWQRKSQDNVNITANSLVNEVMGDKYKSYPYREVTKNGVSGGMDSFAYPEEYFAEYTTGMISAAQAAAYGGSVLDSFYQDISFSDIVFDIYLIEANGWPAAYEGIKYQEGYGFEFNYRYRVDAYSGNVVQFSCNDSKMNGVIVTEQQKNNGIDIPSEIYDIISDKAVKVAERMGYNLSKVEDVEIIYGGLPENESVKRLRDKKYYTKYLVLLNTAQDTQLQIVFADSMEKDYPLIGFMNLSWYL